MRENLAAAIKSAVRPLILRSYFDSVPPRTGYPHCVYTFTPSFKRDESSEGIGIDFDGFDCPANGSMVALEQLMLSLEALDGATVAAGDVIATLSLSQRAQVPVDDKQIKQLRYSFSAVVYRKE